MLNAAREAARKTLTLQRLTIKNEELGFYANNLAMISANSAMFSGFGLEALSSHKDEVGDNANEFLVGMMMVCYAITLATNLSSLVTGCFCSIQAPGLALRGGGDAIVRACHGIRKEHVWTLSFHLTGLFSFVLGLSILCFLRMPRPMGIAMCGIFGSSFLLGVYRIKHMKQGLAISQEKLDQEREEALQRLAAPNEHELEAEHAAQGGGGGEEAGQAVRFNGVETQE